MHLVEVRLNRIVLGAHDGCAALRDGLVADFIVLSENPLKVPVNELEKIKLEETYFAGVKYQKKASSPAALVLKSAIHKAR